MSAKTGQVSYGARGFHQDAMEAMRGDIHRGLIEAITNADDAYGDEKGKIWIGIEHRRGPWKVVIRDRACGMRAKDLEERIARLAERTSGFERGEAVRGNLGRGAKDLAAFGVVVFESIKDEYYAKLTLQPTGVWRLEPERRATREHRESLHIQRGGGTVVTVHVNERIRCPLHGRLKEQLQGHYQLRDIMSDSRREVILSHMNTGHSDRLRYSAPALPVVFQGDVAIAGYDATASVTIYRSEERCDEPASDVCRVSGLLVKGRRAIYENTLFKFENNPHAGWFSGVVDCSRIDELARQYDDEFVQGRQPPADNPVPIVRRSRDGLQATHPFSRALAEAIEKPLGDLVAVEERKAKEGGARETARMRRSLDALGRDLARLMNEDLREIDAEEVLSGNADEAPPIRLVPGEAVLYMREDKTLTVQVRADLGIDHVTAEVDPEGVVELLDSGPIELVPHARAAHLKVGRVRVRPLLEHKETLLEVAAGNHSAVALLEVEPERIPEEEEVVPPEALLFERESYRVTAGKRRKLRLLAPVHLVADSGVEVVVTSSNREVPVLEGGKVKLRLDDVLEYYVAEVPIEGRQLGAKAQIVAQLGEQRATCGVIVARDDGGPSLRINVIDDEAGHRRALVDQTDAGLTVNIMGKHPAIRRYLGPAPGFPLQEEPLSRCVIAEIVAGEAARIVVERKHRSSFGDDGADAAGLYVDHSKYLAKYLARSHRMLVAEP